MSKIKILLSIRNSLKNPISKRPQNVLHTNSKTNGNEDTTCILKVSTKRVGITKGNWSEAYDIFIKTRDMLNKDGYTDGPSKVLINYISNRDKTAPDDWQGYRPLTSK